MSRRAVNDYICEQLQRLRKARGLTAATMARRLKLPRSSYSSIETGAYQMKLDFLYEALAQLGADIEDVWPFPHLGLAKPKQETPSHLFQIHQFRLQKIVSNSQADRGLLLSQSGDKVEVHMSCSVSGTELEEITRDVRQNHLPEGYFGISRKEGRTRFVLLLQAEKPPQHLRIQIEHYLAVWATFFRGQPGGDSKDVPQSSDGPDPVRP